MRFVDGLKDLFKRKLFLVIIILYIISMVLFIISYSIVDNFTYSVFVIFFMLGLAVYTFILFSISLFVSVDKISILVLIIALVVTIPIMFLLFNVIRYFATFCIYANQFLTAFFAFKFCSDTSTKVDDFLYRKKGANVTRTIQFLSFFLISVLFTILAVGFFRSSSHKIIINSGSFFYFLGIVEIILVTIVLLRLVFTQKFAAYNTLFYLLIFFYTLYVLLDLWIGWLLRDNTAYDIFSFIFDLIIFLYIIGSIFERVDYIHNIFKIIRADSIAFFVIVLKLIVQTNKIVQEIGLGIQTQIELLTQLYTQVMVLLVFFIFITFIIGIYKIFKHQTK